MQLSRRDFLKGVTSLGLSALFITPNKLLASLSPKRKTVSLEITAKESEFELINGKKTPIWSYNGMTSGFPTLRCRQGDTLKIKFINKLPEQTTIHWHGMRVPLEMDGVPYLSQLPVLPGEYFNYEFECKDAGNFWYHPHEGSTTQMGRGLVGSIIVEEQDFADFVYEQSLFLKTWHVDDNGEFMPFTIPNKAALAGTEGRLHTVNSEQNPTIFFPAGEIVRLRVFNLDNMLTYKLNFLYAEAKIYSIDGQPLEYPLNLTDEFALAAGQRLDIALKIPKAGQKTILRNGDMQIATIKAINNNADIKVLDWPKPLPPNPIPIPDISRATIETYNFGWSTKMLENPEQDDIYQYWQINGYSWDVKDITCYERPITILKHKQHYIFELRNLTQYEHPIHLHGMHFWVFESNKKTIIPHFADTYLLSSFETAKVALVADTIGTWMFHCHILDHMETGMMAAIKVA